MRTSIQLPDRQRMILVLVAKGCANKEIAHRLGISEQTVKWHVSRMLRRFAVPNRTALVRIALNQSRSEVPIAKHPARGSLMRQVAETGERCRATKTTAVCETSGSVHVPQTAPLPAAVTTSADRSEARSGDATIMIWCSAS